MDPVYLDYAATTPMRDEVRDAMRPYLADSFGNPSSLHRWGREAAEGLERARAEAAEALGAEPSEICFTRGGTESDNLAVLGRCRALRETNGVEPTLLLSAVEHHAVHDAAAMADRQGSARVVEIGVSPGGELDQDALESELSAGPGVLSVMWVNNETGLRLPVEAIAERTADIEGIALHSDAVQAVGKVPVSVREVPVDLLTVTGHKIYGPKGTGLLFVRSGTDIAPLLHGGGQERALRPGTEDVAGAVGLATALRLAVEERESESPRLEALRDRLEGDVTARIDGIRINAGEAARAPHITSLGIAGVPGDSLLMALDLEGIAASGGAACSSGSAAGSHVISALYGEQDDRATVRFSLGRGSTSQDVDRAARALVEVVDRLRALEVSA